MKIRNLLLGSIAAAGLATGAQAADLGVLTSLDVCDSLGISGLTISSDTNCLQITGEVKYEFNWGNYRTADGVVVTPAGNFTIANDDGGNDWGSKVEAWVKFVASANSDFGPAKAVIKIREIQEKQWTNNATLDTGDTEAVNFNEAYVSVGDSTVIMAGRKGSIINKGDDEPFNFLALFNSEKVDAGVSYNIGLSDGVIAGAEGAKIKDGGHVIQVVSDLGNGVSVGAGLEALNFGNTTSDDVRQAGTAVGVLSYAGDTLTAHATLMAGGILDGKVNAYALHAGLTGTFDNFKVRGAFAANNDLINSRTNWNGLLSAQATFDMFTIAASVEGANAWSTIGGVAAQRQSLGFGGSVGFAVTEGITINLGGRYFDADTSLANTEGYQVAAQLVAAVTETLKLTGEIGAYGSNAVAANGGFAATAGTYDNVFYGAAEVAWAPGGDFTASLKGQAFSNGGYKATFKAAKTFQ